MTHITTLDGVVKYYFVARSEKLQDTSDMLAMDRSLRHYDKDNRLHVASSPISKATVNPYLGVTIPEYQKLGLDPDKVYRLLRCPEELAKAAPTFNNLPILRRHIPVNADAPAQEDVVGSTGTDAEFDGVYLRNSTVYWTAPAIKGIEDDSCREHSAAYYYRADMTPGVFEGLIFDGIMRDIVGNHVALVPDGRAGPDVLVSDSKLEIYGMARSLYASAASGAIVALVTPRLAMDAKLDISALFKGVKSAANRDLVLSRLKAQTAGKLAQDADIEDVAEVLDALAPIIAEEAAEEEDLAIDEDGDKMAKVLAFLKDKVDDETLAELSRICGAEVALDEEDDKEEKKFDKGAMDAAIRKAEDRAVARVTAIARAKEEVAPLVGQITVAMDSAEDIYRWALLKDGLALDGSHSLDSLRTMTKMRVDAKTPVRRTVIAQDAADAAGFHERNPHAGRLVRA